MVKSAVTCQDNVRELSGNSLCLESGHPM